MANQKTYKANRKPITTYLKNAYLYKNPETQNVSIILESSKDFTGGITEANVLRFFTNYRLLVSELTRYIKGKSK